MGEGGFVVLLVMKNNAVFSGCYNLVIFEPGVISDGGGGVKAFAGWKKLLELTPS